MGEWKIKTKLKKGKKIRHIIYAVYYTAYLPLHQYIITDSGFDNDHK
jgi:hypothetical protein